MPYLAPIPILLTRRPFSDSHTRWFTDRLRRLRST